MERAAGGEAPKDGISARHFAIAWRLALGCWLGCALLQILLYVRPSPYGGPFLLEWRKYFSLALYYDLLGIWLLALPFFLVWLLWWRRQMDARRALAIHKIQAWVMTANLALSALDHELLRFLGIRLGFSFLFTYARPEVLADSLFVDVLTDDPGGPFLPLVLLVAAPAIYLWWAKRLVRRRLALEPQRKGKFWLALLILVVPLAAPANAWRMATGHFRLRKVEPVILALATDAALGFGDFSRPADFAALAAGHKRDWLAASSDKDWIFPDPARPYFRLPATRTPAGPAGGKGWNIIYLQLETFRGADMGFLRAPGLGSPTPYLDSLAARPEASVWARALSFGPPSINGLFAVHCSVTPHSSRYISAFTNVAFECLPEMLRRRGYRAEMFNAGDSDWDNSSFWLTRWYDRLWRFPEAREQDRLVFRAGAKRIRELGASGQPFLATLVSVTNHTPFRSREAGFDIAGQGSPQERILNTTRYTDDVVREFLEGLRDEPWFAHTLVLIAGDHGFNMGEHDRRPGQKNLYRESMWVPLLLLGNHPRLPRGRHDGLVSLLDIEPTLADLLGVREPNAWQGHSLLALAAEPGFNFKAYGQLLAEGGGWSALTDPRDGRALLFDSRSDWYQRRDLARDRPGLARALLARAEARMRLNDYLLRHDRIWPATGPEAGRNAARAKRPAERRRTSPRPSPAPPGS